MDPGGEFQGRPAALEPARVVAPSGALWPDRIRTLARAWHEEPSSARREGPQAELWTLGNLVLQKYVRVNAGRLGTIPLEDIRDIAADKTLDLLRRLDARTWAPWADTTAEVCSFLAVVARNGVVDFLRERRREVPHAVRWESGDDAAADPMDVRPPASAPRDRAVPGEGAEYAKAILDCLSGVAAKARLVWFLRAFYELSSAQAARHPGVASKPAAVDTMVRRVRVRLRACLEGKGHDPERFPTGTFTALWDAVFGPGGIHVFAPGKGGVEP